MLQLPDDPHSAGRRPASGTDPTKIAGHFGISALPVRHMHQGLAHDGDHPSHENAERAEVHLSSSGHWALGRCLVTDVPLSSRWNSVADSARRYTDDSPLDNDFDIERAG